MTKLEENNKELILEQKLSIITQLVQLIKDYNIPLIKKIGKENTSVQLKLMKIKTEILKLDDKIDDIIYISNIADIGTMNNKMAQFLNLINEEKTAYSDILSEEFEKNRNKTVQPINREVTKINASGSLNINTEDMKIKEIYNQMLNEANDKKSIKENAIKSLNDLIENETNSMSDFLNFQCDAYKNAYKEFIALVKLYNITNWTKENFDEYRHLREMSVKITLCDDKNGNIRIYSKYAILKIINHLMQVGLSKRQLPTEVFKYLISNNVIKEKDFKLFSKNQFGRTFESKMGDIITEEELPKDIKRQKRYNKIDFSEIDKSEYKGILYVSNQWSEDSISKFIDYISKNYSDYIEIQDPFKMFIEKMLSNKNIKNKLSK